MRSKAYTNKLLIMKAKKLSELEIRTEVCNSDKVDCLMKIKTESYLSRQFVEGIEKRTESSR